MMRGWERKKVLVTVRTYPTPSDKSVEVSCTAGVTDQGEWIRLFPVPYRFVSPDKRFKKYQWIEVNTKKASDARPESYNLDVDSIEIVSAPIRSDDAWKYRRVHLEHLISHCLCCLKSHWKEPGAPTLGLFKPKEINQLVIQRVAPNWTADELGKLQQSTIWAHAPVNELEKIPFKFSYQMRCDHTTCRGHKMMCTDWEMGASYLKWRSRADGWEPAFRQKYEREMIQQNDTSFFVGTVHGHPKEWIIVGLWYPKKAEGLQTALI